jgi:hypothetical protein
MIGSKSRLGAERRPEMEEDLIEHLCWEVLLGEHVGIDVRWDKKVFRVW